jgi:hypothetical protein
VIIRDGTISDQRNIVAFLLITTRAIIGNGFGPKVREMSVRPTAINIIADHRKAWADLQNAELELAGFTDRVDHRSLAAQREEALAVGDLTKAQGLDRKPQKKLDRRQFQAEQIKRLKEENIKLRASMKGAGE